jgi:hypothetical protein
MSCTNGDKFNFNFLLVLTIGPGFVALGPWILTRPNTPNSTPGLDQLFTEHTVSIIQVMYEHQMVS